MSKITDRQLQEANLKRIIEEAMKSGKNREAVDAIKTLGTMKGWTKGDAEKNRRVIALMLDDVPQVTRESLGLQPPTEQRLELYKELGAFYDKHYK